MDVPESGRSRDVAGRQLVLFVERHGQSLELERREADRYTWRIVSRHAAPEWDHVELFGPPVSSAQSRFRSLSGQGV